MKLKTFLTVQSAMIDRLLRITEANEKRAIGGKRRVR